MKKSDLSKHSICLAAIKRHTIKPYEFRWTRFYETNQEFGTAYSTIGISIEQDELIICSVILDEDNYSILTTRQLVTKEKGIITAAEIDGATGKHLGNFKEIQSSPFTLGSIRTAAGREMHYFIETGKASMIMIYGVQTLINIQPGKESAK